MHLFNEKKINLVRYLRNKYSIHVIIGYSISSINTVSACKDFEKEDGDYYMHTKSFRLFLFPPKLFSGLMNQNTTYWFLQWKSILVSNQFRTCNESVGNFSWQNWTGESTFLFWLRAWLKRFLNGFNSLTVPECQLSALLVGSHNYEKTRTVAAVAIFQRLIAVI